MHHASHILIRCIALWCVITSGNAARTVNPEILANFARNVASVLSPVILGELQSRSNRSFQSFQTEPATLHDDDDLDSHSTLNNIVDKSSPNEATYYEPNSYSYNNLYERSPEELEISRGNRQLQDSFSRDESYLRHEQPNFYKSYDFSTSKDNLEVAPKSTNNENIEASIRNIEGSSTSLYPLYHGADFHKAAFPYGPFLAKPYGGFHGFGPHGHFHHHHHHHHPYGDDGSGESSSEENARLENGTNHHYGPPFGNYGYGHPFPYGGYGHDPFYGSYDRNGNGSENGRNGHYGYGNGYGPYHGGPGFYGYPYGPSYGHNGNNNNNNNNGETSSRQTEEPAKNGNQNNSTKNGYPHFYGPPFLKPIVGPFHGPFPFSFPHYNGIFKGGPVVGVGHVGYPFYADPFLIGFPFHHPYGPFFHGKKYLPPKGKPADSGESGESTETPAGELMEESPDRITAPNEEVVAPASSSNRYKTSGRKGSKRTSSIVNFDRKV